MAKAPQMVAKAPQMVAKPLAVAKVHAHWWLKYTQLSTERT